MRTLLTALIAAAALHAEPLLQVDFEADALGGYTQAMVQKEWPGVTWSNGLSDGRATVVSGDSVTGKAVRIAYPAKSFGPSLGGAQWRAFLAGSHDTVTMSYRVRFGTGFDFVKGGKLPGLCGSKCNTGGNVPHDTDGWSARLMWRDTAGHAVQYLYFPGQPGTYGLDLPWKVNGKACAFGKGQWHEVRTRIVLNTPRRNGQPALKDGRITSWFDGQLALDTAGFLLRGEDTMHVNQFYFSTFHGGSDSTWAPPRDVSALFDDFDVQPGSPNLGVGPRAQGRPFRLVRTSNGTILADRPLPEGTRLRLFRPDGQILSNTAGIRGTVLWKLEDLRGKLLEQGSSVLP